MKVVLLGATGATGKRLAKQLLAKKHRVTAIVRNTKTEALAPVASDANFTQVLGTVLDFSEEELAKHVSQCEAICVCLGHNLSFGGIFGKPRLLVTDSLKKIVRCVGKSDPKKKIKLVLMSSNGCQAHGTGLEEKYSRADRFLLGLFYFLLPPHKDNVLAAKWLRSDAFKQAHPNVEWVQVRPGDLIENESEAYEMMATSTSGALFGSDQTSRLQVAHCMAALIDTPALWHQWKGQQPVLKDLSEARATST